MAEHIAKRNEIDNKYKWNLSHIFKNDAEWSAAYRIAEKHIEEYSKYDGNVEKNPCEAIKDFYKLYGELLPIASYAFLGKEADNSDPHNQEMSDKADLLYVKFSTYTSFLQPELLAMNEDDLKKIQTSPDMVDYSEMLRSLLLQKPHTLPKEQEKILAMASEIEGAPNGIYSMLSNVDMKFPGIMMPDGTEKPLTDSNYMSYIYSADRNIRKQAFDGMMGTFGNFGNTIAASYSSSVKVDTFNANVRNYSSARAAAMEPLEIPESVYDNLISVVHEYIPVLNEYLSLRKKVLKLDELHMYDLYTPMVSDFSMDLPYEKAFDLVLEGLQPMGQDYIDKLVEAKDGGWIDVMPSEGKSSGAFSSGELVDVHPYVLLNHNNNLESAFTIAHELGHAMHSYYSNSAQPLAKADYSLFVAEVASTCNEAIMQRSLLKKFTDPKAQAYLLNHFLEQFRTTCFRQTMFAEFEKITHEMYASGKPLTKDAMSKVYYDLNKTYYGGVCTVDDLIANEWMRIPHFYRAFYVYVYATGLCAAVYLSDRILTGGEDAVKDYKKFLSAGSSLPPIEALKIAGIDMSKPEPIRRAMEVFKETLHQFERIL